MVQPDHPSIVVPPEHEGAPPAVDQVKCETCIYFRAFNAQETREVRGLVTGDGWCYAQPPQISVRASRADPTAAVIEPMRPPTRAGDVCRFWRAEFAGDATYASADALEVIAVEFERLTMFLRELVSAGGKR